MKLEIEIDACDTLIIHSIFTLISHSQQTFISSFLSGPDHKCGMKIKLLFLGKCGHGMKINVVMVYKGWQPCGLLGSASLADRQVALPVNRHPQFGTSCGRIHRIGGEKNKAHCYSL